MAKFSLCVYLLICTVIFPCAAQLPWKIVCLDEIIKDALYNIRSANPHLSGNYQFIDENNFGKISRGGIELKKKHDRMKYRITPSSPLRINPSELAIYLNCYSNHVQSYVISFHSSESGAILNYSTPIYRQGYELYPQFVQVKVDSASCTPRDSYAYWKNTQNISINEISFEIIPQKDEVPEFAIGDFLLVNALPKEIEITHPWIGSETTIAFESSPESTPFLYPAVSYTNAVRSDWHIRTQGDERTGKCAELDALTNLFQVCLEKYPFYKERRISRDSLLARFNKVVAKRDSIGSPLEFARQLQPICSALNDGHFSLRIPTSGASAKSAPVRVACFNGICYISAIFLKDSISQVIGARLLEIDSIPVDKLAPITGGNDIFENSINRYITKAKDASTCYLVNLNGRDTTFTVSHSAQGYIPANFKPIHRDFRTIGRGIAYYRLNQFMPGDFIDFVSHIDALQQANGIIFDLRGNGGGNSGIAASILSTFIHRPANYGTETDLFGNRRSIIVRKHPSLHLECPVIILVDENTACCSEAFAEAMRICAGAIIMGKARTKGAYAALTEITFPSGFTLKTNIFSDHDTVSSGQEIETTGIAPDVWVDIRQVEDLFPYRDKCLQYAVCLLEAH